MHEVLRVVKAHSSGPLNDRFEDKGRQGVGFCLHFPFQRFDHREVHRFGKPSGKGIHEVLNSQAAVEDPVHPGYRVADRHGMPGVAVIPVADGHKGGLGRFRAGALVLERHLHGYFHRDRTRIGIKDLVQALGQHREQTLGQTDGRGMGQPAEHYVRGAGELRPGGTV